MNFFKILVLTQVNWDYHLTLHLVGTFRELENGSKSLRRSRRIRVQRGGTLGWVWWRHLRLSWSLFFMNRVRWEVTSRIFFLGTKDDLGNVPHQPIVYDLPLYLLSVTHTTLFPNCVLIILLFNLFLLLSRSNVLELVIWSLMWLNGIFICYWWLNKNWQIYQRFLLPKHLVS